MRGITKIELTDVHTGEKEVYEDENIITNAAQLYTSLFSTLYAKGEGLSPLYNSVFGGVKLFGEVIEENADNYLLPNIGTHPIVGYASNDTTPGTDAMRGSRNLIETTPIENGMRIVWDFATSEANGEIKCVSLVNQNAGKNVFVYDGYNATPAQIVSVSSNSSSYNEIDWIVDYDYVNGIITTIGYNKTTRKRRYKLALSEVKLNDKIMVLNLIDEVNIDPGMSTPPYQFKNDRAGHLYRLKSKTNTAITLEKFDLITDEFSDVVLNVSNVDCRTGYQSMAVRDGFLYVLKTSYEGYYRINLSNTSDVKEVILPKSGNYNSSNHHITTLDNGNILSDGLISDPETGNYLVVCKDYNVEGGSIYGGYLSSSSSRSNVKLDYLSGNGCEIFTSYGDNPDYYSSKGVININSNMLMSINNLDTPVIKTADKTMKITYTLLYEEEVTV